MATRYMVAQYAAGETLPDASVFDENFVLLQDGVFKKAIDGDWVDVAAGPQGDDGVDGADGADGAPGADGSDGSDGADGAPGADGADGAPGVDGADGAPGPALLGGTTGQVLTKLSDDDGDYAWADPA